MARMEGFRVRNFKVLKDVSLGGFGNREDAMLTPITAVIGKNGVGKSTLFDSFGFLADCLKSGVEEACDGRGGYRKILSQGQKGSIKFEVYYRENANSRPITYELSVALDRSDRPFVQKERLRQRRKGETYGQPYSFLALERGEGYAWRGSRGGFAESPNGLNFEELGKIESKEKERVQLEDRRRLGIATLGSLKQHPRIAAFRRFIESWYLSYFTPDAARGLPLAGPQKHLNTRGDNLGNVVQFLEREHPGKFQGILKQIAEKIPGVEKINTETSSDGRLLLQFNDSGFNDTFYARHMSDGTLKVFAYLLLMEDPNPPPFLCIEEPENGLYHKLLESLAQGFREHAERKGGSQVFVTTHQPYLVDALNSSEVWILEKGRDGFSTIHRASSLPVLKELEKEGLPLGGLWYSDYLDKR